jgi:hypothetical protein
MGPFEPAVRGALQLTAHVVLVLVTLAYLGVGVGYFTLARRLRQRLVLAAPQVGLALLACVPGIASLLGVPVVVSGWVVAAGATITNLVVLWRLRSRRPGISGWAAGRRALGAQLRFLAATTVGVCAVSSVYLFKDVANRFPDPWGSSDFFGYWITAEYLYGHGATQAAQRAQGEFQSVSLLNHWLTIFRPGSSAVLAFFGLLGGRERIIAFVQPLICATIVLALASLRLLLDAARIRSSIPVAAACLCSFTYFTLYYSYLAQGVGVALLLAGFIVLHAHLRDARGGVVQGVAAGLILVAAVLSHEAQASLLASGLGAYLIAIAGTRWRAGRGLGRLAARGWVPGLVLAAAGVLFGARLYATTRYFASLNPMVGWEWPRLPDLSVLLGLASPFTVSGARDDGWAELWGAGMVAAVSAHGVARRLPAALLGSLVLAEVLLILVALHHVVLGTGNASHAVWKATSLFAFVVPFAFAVGVLTLQRRLGDRPLRRAVTALVLWLWLACELVVVLRTPPKPSMLGYRAVQLIRRNMERYRIVTPVRGQWLQAVARNPERHGVRGIEDDGTRRVECHADTVFLWDRASGGAGQEIDAAGRYRLGFPPQRIDFSRSPADAWMIRGFHAHEPHFRWAERRAVLVLGRPTATLEADLLVDLPLLRATRGASVDGQPMELVVNDVKVASFMARPEQVSYRFTVPPWVRDRCARFALIEFRAAYDYQAGLGVNAHDTRRIAWGLRRIAFLERQVASGVEGRPHARRG